MKKRNWLLLLLIVLCLAAFFGYRKLDQLRTDTRAPQIHIDEQPLEVSVRDDKSALLAGVTASDNVDGDNFFSKSHFCIDRHILNFYH